MITNEQLIDGFSLNLRLIKLQTAGLSHADSLIQTPYNINCMNWVLGHIAVNRDNVMRLIGAEPLLRETEIQRYKTESDPVTNDGPDVMQLESILVTALAGAGVMGIAIGFAAKDVISNMLSGIFINIDKPFRIGDIIEVKGVGGQHRWLVLLRYPQS